MQLKKYSTYIVLAVVLGVASLTASAQPFTLLHAFAKVSNGTNTDGSFPLGAMAQAGNVLYGTTFSGGAYSNGTVFAVNMDGTGFTNLHVFTVFGGVFRTNLDGAAPGGSLLVWGQKIYGTTGQGGPGRVPLGTVFGLNTDGTGFTNLHVFSGNTDGSATIAGLTVAGGRLYGAAQSGGTNGDGMIFGMNPDGSAYTNLYSFIGGGDGKQPLATMAAWGTNLFGSCSGGGISNGTVFRLNTDGSGFTTLHVFSGLTAGTNSDGAMPYIGGLTVNGTNLFGCTRKGGRAGNGILYRMNFDGSGFTNLHSFTAVNNLTNEDGALPASPLFSSGDTLYGTTGNGGVSSNGTVFVVNTDGSGFKVLYAFSPTLNLTNGDGTIPVSVLLSSNTLYGVARAGGNGSGTVFRLFVPPSLNLGFAGGSAVLAWPTNANGFILQSSSNLFSPTGWVPVAPAPVPVNGQNVVTDSFSGGQMFYRLTR